MSKRNIVIAPCGNKSSLFRESWLKYKDEKEFELCLLFYHEQINNPELYNVADHFFHLKGFKYHMLYELLTKVRPEWLEQYDYFYFLDDDIDIDTRGINEMFASSKGFGGAITCAALSLDSFCSWPIFKQKKGSYCRWVGQIEVMAPLFEKGALKACLPSFVENRSSWGVDAVWSKILGYPEDKLIVFDKILMKHTLPVGGGELYKKIGVDPHVEWKAIIDKYQAMRHNYTEYGRLQVVNKDSSRMKFRWHKAEEMVARRKQAWNDYDLRSRVVSRWNKLFNPKHKPGEDQGYQQ